MPVKEGAALGCLENATQRDVEQFQQPPTQSEMLPAISSDEMIHSKEFGINEQSRHDFNGAEGTGNVAVEGIGGAIGLIMVNDANLKKKHQEVNEETKE